MGFAGLYPSYESSKHCNAGWVEPKAKPITAVTSPPTSCCLLRCAVIQRRDRLPLHRLAALDRLAIGGVVLHERRQPFALPEHRRFLQVDGQVRFAGVAPVAPPAELAPGAAIPAQRRKSLGEGT